MKKNIEFKIKKVVPVSKKDEIHFRRRCYTGVSISNPFFTGDLVVPFFKWMIRNFSYVCIFIDDYFHKYNEMSFRGVSETEAVRIAVERGNYIQNYIQNVIDQTFDEAYRFKIIKSSNLSSDSLFEKNKVFFEKTFMENEYFRKGIEKSSRDYLLRQIKRGNSFALEESSVIQNCNSYLIDEVAVFTTLCEKGYDVEVYPGPELPILIDIADGKFENMPSALLNRINIELKKK